MIAAPRDNMGSRQQPNRPAPKTPCRPDQCPVASLWLSAPGLQQNQCPGPAYDARSISATAATLRLYCIEVRLRLPPKTHRRKLERLRTQETIREPEGRPRTR